MVNDWGTLSPGDDSSNSLNATFTLTYLERLLGQEVAGRVNCLVRIC